MALSVIIWAVRSMSIEILNYGKDLIIPTTLTVPFLMAFSLSIRKAIGRRDGWACQAEGCDKRFQDGWMVHAAHYPELHDKNHPEYDTEDAGRILCVEHHIEDHESGTTLGAFKDGLALALLKATSHFKRD